ncbi:uncharacterized protein [Ptychodera flava]|uniref:uncharacterized protein n=1 Tax=Ptychodera flava TaxID=63121 RepID=UPI00396A4311
MADKKTKSKPPGSAGTTGEIASTNTSALPPLPNQAAGEIAQTAENNPSTATATSGVTSTSRSSVASKWKGAAGTAAKRPSVMVSTSSRPGTATENDPKRLSVDSRKLSIDGSQFHHSRRPSRVSVVSVDYPNKLQLQQINAAATQSNGHSQGFQQHVKISEKGIRAAIPIMPMPIAIMCCTLNFIIPGSGTIISGFTLFCCSSPQDHSKKDEITDQVCTNLWVGVSQLMTITFLLVGWFWSIAWGVLMLQVAKSHILVKKQEKEIQTALTVASAFMSNTHNTF